jgi:hypothetical protein
MTRFRAGWRRPDGAAVAKRPIPPAVDVHPLGLEVGAEELVEPLGGAWSLHGAVRRANDVVDHVVGVHGHGAVGIARHLGGDVLLDE